MSYVVQSIPQNPKAPFSETFPALTADLAPDVVKELDLAPALERFAKELMKQYKQAGPHPSGAKPIIGVRFLALEFSFILDASQKVTT